MLLRETYHISLLSLLVFLPVFLSIGHEGVIGFDRLNGDDIRKWIITIPITIILSLLFVASKINKIHVPKSSFLLLFYLCVSALFVFFGGSNGVDLAAIKVIVLMATFIYLFHGFEYYFNKKLNFVSTWENSENKYILYPLVFILLIVLLSYAFFLNVMVVDPAGNVFKNVHIRGVFITEYIKIYNFNQYFAFVFVPMIASATRLRIFYFFALSIASLYLAFITDNRTAFVLMVALIVYYLIDKMIVDNWRSLFDKVTKILLIVFPVFYLLIMFSYVDADILDIGLLARYNYIQGYFSNLQWYQIILPILNQPRSFSNSMHNETLEIFNATSLLGLVLYYYFILKQVASFSDKYKMQGVSILLVVFVAGTMVENTLHMYLLVAIACIIAFYAVASRSLKEPVKD